jgi:hypothetical protein
MTALRANLPGTIQRDRRGATDDTTRSDCAAPKAGDAPLKDAAGSDSDRKRNFRRRRVMPAANGSHGHLQAPSSRKREPLIALSCILAQDRVPTTSLACQVMCPRPRRHNLAHRPQSTARISRDFASVGERLQMPLFRGSIKAAHGANDLRDVAWGASKPLAIQPAILTRVGTSLHSTSLGPRRNCRVGASLSARAKFSCIGLVDGGPHG